MYSALFVAAVRFKKSFMDFSGNMIDTETGYGRMRPVISAMNKKDRNALAVIVGFYALIELLDVTCPIKFVTGISCAGCGMSRAWLSLLRMDVAGAFAYHPLFWLPVPAALILLFRRRLPKRMARVLLLIICVLFLAVYLVRLARPEDTVVVFAPQEGLIWRLFSALRQGLQS